MPKGQSPASLMKARYDMVSAQLDRAEAFIGLNLWTDARNTAYDAEKKAKALGVHYEAAKAALFYAKASYVVGEIATARKALKRALIGFKKERNKAFL